MQETGLGQQNLGECSCQAQASCGRPGPGSRVRTLSDPGLTVGLPQLALMVGLTHDQRSTTEQARSYLEH